jgi:hypothetical protein
MSNVPFQQEPPSEEVLLQRIAKWEEMREFWLQVLKENPHLVARLDERTRINLGFA